MDNIKLNMEEQGQAQDLQPVSDEKQAPETPVAPEAAGTDTPESSSPEEDGTTEEKPSEMVFPRVLAHDTRVLLEELDRERAIATLQKSGYLDEDARPTERLLKKVHRLQRKASRDIRLEVSYRVLMADLLAAGIKFAFAKDNRQIHHKHVDDLISNVKDTPDCCFVESGRIIEARTLLEEGLELVDENDVPLTLETEDIDCYFAILDSQHRYVAARSEVGINLMLELADYSGGSIPYISTINNDRLGWDGVDRKHSIITRKGDAVSLLKDIDEIKTLFKISDKCAEFALTGKKDQFKTDELVQVQLGEREPGEKFRTPEGMKDRAMETLTAIRLSFSDQEQKKPARKIQCIEAFYNIGGYLVEEEAKDAYGRNLPVFIMRGMSPKDKQDFIARVTDPATEGDPKPFIWQLYNDYVTKNAGKLDGLYDGVKKDIAVERGKLAKGEDTGKVTTQKMGTPKEILQNIKEVAAEQKRKKEEKLKKEQAAVVAAAVKEAEKVTKGAEASTTD